MQFIVKFKKIRDRNTMYKKKRKDKYLDRLIKKGRGGGGGGDSRERGKEREREKKERE